MSAVDQTFLLRELLKGVSRSFYLSMRVLPPVLRAPIGVAYLLARAADTLADTAAVAPTLRLEYLQRFRACLFAQADAGELTHIAAALSDQLLHDKERVLLQRLPEVFALFRLQPEADQVLILNVLQTLTDGMCFDLRTFPPESDAALIVALQEQAQLDQYTYWVAGCVGEFWTRVSHRHVVHLQAQDSAAAIDAGVRFGQALQLTNILRDLPRDLRIGRCYLPTAVLQPLGLKPVQLLAAENTPASRQLLRHYLTQALENYAAAEAYVLSIPPQCRRLRLAALWPALIGIATLGRLSQVDHWLDPQAVVKVERGWVYRMIWRSLWQVGNDAKLRVWFAALRAEVNLG